MHFHAYKRHIPFTPDSTEIEKLSTCQHVLLPFYTVGKMSICTILLTCYRFDIYGCQKLVTDYTKTFINCFITSDTAERFYSGLLCFQVVFAFSGSVTTADPLYYVICKFAVCLPHHRLVFVFACMGRIPTPFGVSS